MHLRQRGALKLHIQGERVGLFGIAKEVVGSQGCADIRIAKCDILTADLPLPFNLLPFNPTFCGL